MAFDDVFFTDFDAVDSSHSELGNGFDAYHSQIDENFVFPSQALASSQDTLLAVDGAKEFTTEQASASDSFMHVFDDTGMEELLNNANFLDDQDFRYPTGGVCSSIPDAAVVQDSLHECFLISPISPCHVSSAPPSSSSLPQGSSSSLSSGHSWDKGLDTGVVNNQRWSHDCTNHTCADLVNPTTPPALFGDVSHDDHFKLSGPEEEGDDGVLGFLNLLDMDHCQPCIKVESFQEQRSPSKEGSSSGVSENRCENACTAATTNIKTGADGTTLNVAATSGTHLADSPERSTNYEMQSGGEAARNGGKVAKGVQNGSPSHQEQRGSAGNDGPPSEGSDDGGQTQTGMEQGGTEAEKKQLRLIRNRESAHQSRQRKKQQMDGLEKQLESLKGQLTTLTHQVKGLQTENALLHRQLQQYGPLATPAVVGMANPAGHPAVLPMHPLHQAQFAAQYFATYGQAPPPIPYGVQAPRQYIPLARVPTAGVSTPSVKAKAPRKAKVKKEEEPESAVGAEGRKKGGRKRAKTAASGAGVALLALFCFTIFGGPWQTAVEQNPWLSTNDSGAPGTMLRGGETMAPAGGGHGGGRVLMGVEEETSMGNTSLEGSGFRSSGGSAGLSSDAWPTVGQEGSNWGRQHLHFPWWASRLGWTFSPPSTSPSDWQESDVDTERNSNKSIGLSDDELATAAVLSRVGNKRVVSIDRNRIISAIVAVGEAAMEETAIMKAEQRNDSTWQSADSVLLANHTGKAEREGEKESRQSEQQRALARVAVKRDRGQQLFVDSLRAARIKQEAIPLGDRSASARAKSSSSSMGRGEGKFDNWFLDGVAGPVLSSGACTEVFHFDTAIANAKLAAKPRSSGRSSVDSPDSKSLARTAPQAGPTAQSDALRGRQKREEASDGGAPAVAAPRRLGSALSSRLSPHKLRGQTSAAAPENATTALSPLVMPIGQRLTNREDTSARQANLTRSLDFNSSGADNSKASEDDWSDDYSMVVSVLASPWDANNSLGLSEDEEAAGKEGEGVGPSLSSTQIFVVVLVNGVRYVTYSCMLPVLSASASGSSAGGAAAGVRHSTRVAA
eukprot:TRINITY_DN1726_c0_g1_i1.p1 TRINITY_DN1726_c0_g1~~TRINITY_DN1726_c0_g1_i1.p1  ORF type:complete len:1071 (+),score=180.21 TRINITY_DN1726_c0_g1_i1:147-3359(+)